MKYTTFFIISRVNGSILLLQWLAIKSVKFTDSRRGTKVSRLMTRYF